MLGQGVGPERDQAGRRGEAVGLVPAAVSPRQNLGISGRGSPVWRRSRRTLADMVSLILAPSRRRVPTRPEVRQAWAALALGVACAASYAVFLVVPYYVNGLDRFPLAEVALGSHDPDGLWPAGTALEPVFGLGSLFALSLAPLLASGTLIWSGWQLWLHRRTATWRTRTLLVVAAFVSSTTVSWLASPFGSSLVSWQLD